MDITIEQVEAVICRSLSQCVRDNYATHLEIAIERLKDELCYDPFEIVADCVDATSKDFPYNPEAPFILTPPYTQICNIEIITCNTVDAQELDCEWRPVTRKLDYNATCFDAIEHCSDKCGCNKHTCYCGDCLTIRVTATWGCDKPDLILLLAACMEYDAGCNDNVKSKNVAGFGSVTYFDKKDPFEKYGHLLRKYSQCRGLDVC